MIIALKKFLYPFAPWIRFKLLYPPPDTADREPARLIVKKSKYIARVKTATHWPCISSSTLRGRPPVRVTANETECTIVMTYTTRKGSKAKFIHAVMEFMRIPTGMLEVARQIALALSDNPDYHDIKPGYSWIIYTFRRILLISFN